MSELDRLCERLKIRADVKYGNGSPRDPEWQKSDPGAHPWTVTLRFGRRRITVPFWTGSMLTKEPTAADVLSCIVRDAEAGEQDFADFCADFGYDQDSRRAERTWKTCRSMAPRVRRFLGEHFEDVAQAEH